VVNKGRKITWSPRAQQQLRGAIEYIRLDSPQNADMVKKKILAKVERLADSSVTHPQDPYKTNNDGHFRYFELLKYRISYYEKENEVILVRLRHVSMKPASY
jgi:plasmid stabilization system protein ParE